MPIHFRLFRYRSEGQRFTKIRRNPVLSEPGASLDLCPCLWQIYESPASPPNSDESDPSIELQTLRSTGNMGLPSVTTTKGGTLVHPLFRRKKLRTKNSKAMIKAKDYDTVVRRPAVLASRLLDSPQALHFFCVTYFGKNLEMPCCNDHERCVSDKGINDLSLDDIKATREQLLLLVDRVQFEFVEMETAWGKTSACKQLLGERGCRSVIKLSACLYSAAQNKDRGATPNARIDLIIAATMLHELVHAAINDVKGNYVEDCFEESLVAEAGFEFETRLFGLIPYCIDWKQPSYETMERSGSTGKHHG